MKPFTVIAAALVLSGATWIGACGDSTSSAPPSTVLDTSGFRGVLVANDGTDGVFELRTSTGASTQSLRIATSSPITLSGTVTLGNGLTAQVTGTYDPNTQTVTASGAVQTGFGTIAFTARYANGRLDGTWTGPNGLNGSLSGLGLSLGPVSLYCGPFVGARQGRLNLAVSGSLAGGAAVFAGNQALLLTGSATASSVDLSFANSGRATGAIAGAAVSGDWSDAAGNGTFSATTAGCPVLGVPTTPPVDAGSEPDAGNPDGSTGDGGVLPAGQLFAETESIGDIVVAGDYVAYTYGFTKAISFVKKDGTGHDKTADVCESLCLVPVAFGSSVIFLDGLNVKKVTPPNKTVTTLGTVPVAMLYARADDRYVYFSTQTNEGFYRFDTQQTNSSNNIGRPLGNFDLVSGTLYYTDTGVSSDYAFRKFQGTFTEEPSPLQARANLTPDTVFGGVAAEATGSVFLTSEQPSEGVHVRWVDNQSGAGALITTIPKRTDVYAFLVNLSHVKMDATNVYMFESAVGQTLQGRMLYVSKATRNGTGASELVAFPTTKVRAFQLDAANVYIGLQDGRLLRQPKP